MEINKNRSYMNRYFFYIILVSSVAAFSSCKSTGGNGQVIGVQDRPEWQNEQPIGMNYVKAGQLYVGQSDEDINMSMYQRPMSVTIAGFYIDDTEITNNEYRQFVHWVRDSIAHVALDHMYEHPMTGEMRIDWQNYPLDFSSMSPQAEDLEFMYYDESERINGKRELDVRQLKYTWDWINKKKVAKLSAEEAHEMRSELIERDTVMVYPDTLVWMRDFEYAYNEPMSEGYFNHPAYDNYPVVGVTWEQARAFSNWSTKVWEIARYNENATKKKKNRMLVDAPNFRLPTEYEFEYAARGGRLSATYPWGLNYLRNGKGCLLANFKPGRGDYAADGGFYTVAVGHYNPNDFGLYDMAGNVSEWTESQFVEASGSYIHDMNPTITYNAEEDDPVTWKRKVIRGGSWKDIGYYLQTGVRDYEFQDSAKSYIGFRRVASLRGRTLTD